MRGLGTAGVSTYHYLLELFLEHREEIQHPEPKIAVSLNWKRTARASSGPISSRLMRLIISCVAQ